MDNNNGQMVPNTKDFGKIIKPTDKELSGMSTVTSMKDNGKEIKHMELESTPI